MTILLNHNVNFYLKINFVNNIFNTKIKIFDFDEIVYKVLFKLLFLVI